MGSESKPWLIWLAVAASGLVHVGAAAGVSAFAFTLPAGEATMTSEIDISVMDMPADDLLPLPPLEPEHIPDDTARRPRLATLVPSRTDSPSVSPSVEPQPNVEPSLEQDEPLDPDRPRPLINLDPASVAAAAVVYDAPVTESEGATADRPLTAQEHEEAMEEALSGSLSAAANARPHVSRRPPPRLRPRRDGSFVFEGPRFSAVIAPDGRVSFNDRSGVELDTPNLGPGGLMPSGSFDLSDAIEGARGQDPYRVEREWFMRETRELRERLEDEVSARQHTRGMAALGGQLRRLWAGRGTATEKRRRIFSMWDDFAEDEVGARARAAVVAFIRRTLPEGSANAFTTAELSRMNRERLSRTPFAPY